MKYLKKYIFNILISIDQLANTVTLGDPDETISSRIAKKRARCRFCAWLCHLLNKLDKGHCDESIEVDEGKNAL